MTVALGIAAGIGCIGVGFIIGAWFILSSSRDQRAIDNSLLLNARRDNGRLSRRIFKLRQQNRYLRSLLTTNGISTKSTVRRQAQAASH